MAFLSTIGKALKSRTVWVGLGTTALGGAQLGAQVLPYVAPYVPAGTKLGALITATLGILTVIARIRAKQPLGPVIDTTVAQTLEAVHVLGASSAARETGAITGLTTIANPLSVEGRAVQLAEVKSVVKAVQAAGGVK